MKKLLIYTILLSSIFFLLGCKTKSIAENEKPIKTNEITEVQGKATYLYQFKPRKYLLEQETTLYFDNFNSVFYYNKGKEPFVVVEGENGIDGYMQDEIGDIIFKDFKVNQTRIREKIWGKPFYTEEPLPLFKWKITENKKTIGNYECIMAETDFRGRHYEAWFAPKIPFGDGPWKFNGLPGLILEIYDKNKDYIFTLKSVEIPNKETISIQFVENGTHLLFDEFIKAEDVEFEKEKKKAEAKYEGAPGTFTMTKQPSNPIELEYEE